MPKTPSVDPDLLNFTAVKLLPAPAPLRAALAAASPCATQHACGRGASPRALRRASRSALVVAVHPHVPCPGCYAACAWLRCVPTRHASRSARVVAVRPHAPSFVGLYVGPACSSEGRLLRPLISSFRIPFLENWNSARECERQVHSGATRGFRRSSNRTSFGHQLNSWGEEFLLK